MQLTRSRSARLIAGWLGLISAAAPMAATAPPPSEPAAIAALHAAAATEATIRSGRMDYVTTEQRVRLTDDQVRSLSWRLTPQQLEVQLQINRQQRGPITTHGHLLFDHRQTPDCLVAWGVRSHLTGSFRSVWGPDGLWLYHDGVDPKQPKPSLEIWPPQRPGSPHDLLAGTRFRDMLADAQAKKARVKVVHGDPAAGLAVILASPHGSELGYKIWLNTRDGYRSVRQETIGLTTGRVRGRFTIRYGAFGGLRCPVAEQREQLGYDRAGTPLVVERTHTRVTAAELNGHIRLDELRFGTIPMGTWVVDVRFDPPLKYPQREHQYTDEERFQLHRALNLGVGSGERPRPAR